MLEKSLSVLEDVTNKRKTPMEEDGDIIFGKHVCQSLKDIKHLLPISLTPILSKLAEDHIVEKYVKPAVLQRIDPRQLGTDYSQIVYHTCFGQHDT